MSGDEEQQQREPRVARGKTNKDVIHGRKEDRLSHGELSEGP